MAERTVQSQNRMGGWTTTTTTVKKGTDDTRKGKRRRRRKPRPAMDPYNLTIKAR